MTSGTRIGGSTLEQGPRIATDTFAPPDAQVFHENIHPRELEPFETWPRWGAHEYAELEGHPRALGIKYDDAKATAAEFEARQLALIDDLGPKHRELGDDYDDPGKLTKYHKHRIAEAAVARAILQRAVPRAKTLGRYDDADRLYKRAAAMLSCRQRGPVGYNDAGKLVVAWKEKCGLSKYCPDEALKDSKRLAERVLPAIREHRRKGGDVHKAWFTMPNYPVGRLKEGVRHLPRRFRNKVMRSIESGQQMFPIDGALVIIEAPLGRDRDWNVHANVILLTSKFLDYRKLREHWGFNVEIRKHSDFSDAGMAGLFNEMIKYSIRALPDKSSDDEHRNKAPAMAEWTGDELLEWDCAMHGYRRTRGYGSLFRLGEIDKTPSKVLQWLAYLEYQPSGYRIIKRSHDLEMHLELLLRQEHFDLESIRGHKSPTRSASKWPTGPP